MRLHEHDKTLRLTSLLAVLTIVFQCGVVTAQGDRTESGSAAPAPSASTVLPPAGAGPVRPGDIAAFLAQSSCVPTVIHTAEELGIPAGAFTSGSVDAMTHGQDVIPMELGPALGGQLPAGTTSSARYSVNATSSGLAGGVVREEADGTDGVASDVYEVAPYNAPVGLNALLYSDFQEGCIYPLGSTAGETDLDAIDAFKANSRLPNEEAAWIAAGSNPASDPGPKTAYPIFYSVDPPTAASMGVSPADILVVTAPGAIPIVFLTAAELGLGPGDDIDGLAIEAPDGMPVRICCSLTSGSPTANAAFTTPAFLVSLGVPLVTIPALGGAGVYELAGVAVPWATAEQMGLLDTDEMNALSIGDPNESCVPNHPGTEEDLVMLTGVDGPLNCHDVKPAGPGSVLDIFVESPGGTFHWEDFAVAGQIFTSQTPPGALPGLHINTFQDPVYGGYFILVDGFSGGNSLFGAPPLLPGGNFNSFLIGNPALQGVNIMLQAVAISQLALNGILAASDGHVLIL